MSFRVVRTNLYNHDLGLIHSTNGNHLESPNEGSSIDHQVTIYLHAQNITMFPTNETCGRDAMSFSDSDVVSGMTCPSERAVLVLRRRLVIARCVSLLFTEAYILQLPAVDSSDGCESGSAGLLLLGRFVLYLFRRLVSSWKKIAKEAALGSLLAFEQIFFCRSGSLLGKFYFRPCALFRAVC
ncbi:hypothetical protein F511_26222 [Dorcoceras hygrometricum]|uniref:Uncharacterized protein n=1 Tax=Dorcoceras hygrometricum TaxID=472368 RepID=A0A2Z7B2F5_9LAMI|nr:hypothetical protein F511_26222 [Dorcoceras hygrometricum]